MGTAWLCRSVGAGDFERLVVVKRPHPHVSQRPDAMLRFIDEARLTGSLHHANVVGTYKVGEDALGPFIVLEYVEGASLDMLVDRAGALAQKVPVSIALRIALDALSGLHAVHTAVDHAGQPLNILHRDISLQNLLVGVDGVCRVADFGAAKSDARNYSTDQRYLLGKLLYLPPEYLRREETGPALDVYSLGVTLWHTLTGVELWQGQSEAQVVAHIIEGEIPSVAEFAAIPPELDALIMKATQADPLQRFQSAELMAQAIEALDPGAGLLATHSEVGRWVKLLVADELAERRLRIAQAREGERSTSGPDAETLAPAPARNRRSAWLAVAVGIAAVVALGVVAALWSDASTASGSVASETITLTAPPPPPPPKEASLHREPSASLVPDVAPDVAPASPAEPKPEPASPAAANASSTRGGAPRPVSSPRKQRKVSSPDRSMSAPDTITVQNPYR